MSKYSKKNFSRARSREFFWRVGPAALLYFDVRRPKSDRRKILALMTQVEATIIVSSPPQASDSENRRLVASQLTNRRDSAMVKAIAEDGQFSFTDWLCDENSSPI